jgi:cytochrome c5
MKKTLAALASLLSLVLLTMPTSCYYDNEEDLYGPDTTACDTAAIRYSVEIKKILEDNCNSCHLPTGVTYSSIPFETHAQLQEVALNGKLVDRTNSISAPMPQTGLMDKCSRLKLEAWVKAGAPNN